MSTDKPWYSVKCVFQHDNISQGEGDTVYEERIIVLKASNFDEAIALGEAEAEAYAGDLDAVRYIGFLSAFQLFDPELSHGTEVYSLMRHSGLDANAFLDLYYDNGSECSQKVQPE